MEEPVHPPEPEEVIDMAPDAAILPKPPIEADIEPEAVPLSDVRRVGGWRPRM